MSNPTDQLIKHAFEQGSLAAYDDYWAEDNPYIYDFEPEIWKAWLSGLLNSDSEVRLAFRDGSKNADQPYNNPFHRRKEGKLHSAWKTGYYLGHRLVVYHDQ